MSETVPFNMLDVGNIKFYEADFTRLDMNGIIKDTSNTTWFSSFNDFWKLMENQKFVLEAITGEPIPDKEEIGNTAHEMPVDYARKLAQSVRLNGEPYPVAPESINELNSRNVVRDIVYRLWYNTKGKTHPDGTIISAEKYETKEPIFVEYTEPYLYVVPDVHMQFPDSLQDLQQLLTLQLFQRFSLVQVQDSNWKLSVELSLVAYPHPVV